MRYEGDMRRENFLEQIVFVVQDITETPLTRIRECFVRDLDKNEKYDWFVFNEDENEGDRIYNVASDKIFDILKSEMPEFIGTEDRSRFNSNKFYLYVAESRRER